jgi:hypothetical protein
MLNVLRQKQEEPMKLMTADLLPGIDLSPTYKSNKLKNNLIPNIFSNISLFYSLNSGLWHELLTRVTGYSPC